MNKHDDELLCEIIIAFLTIRGPGFFATLYSFYVKIIDELLSDIFKRTSIR